MKKALAIADGLLTVLAQLKIPTYATAAAGTLAPIILGLFGDNFPPQTIAGWLVIVGAVAGTVEGALRKTSQPAPTPAPPAPKK